MQSYRLYMMDRRTGHITGFETIEAAADAEAIALAERKVGPQPMELWRNGIKLRRFEIKMPARAAAARSGGVVTAGQAPMAEQQAARIPAI